MSEDTTQNFPKFTPFEERVLSELAGMRSDFRSEIESLRTEFRSEISAIHIELNSINARLTLLEEHITKLEEKVDARLKETRPIWEAIQMGLEKVQDDIRRMNTKFDIVIKEQFEMRADIKFIEKRVTQLEDNLSPQS